MTKRMNCQLWPQGIGLLLVCLLLGSAAHAQEQRRPALVVQSGHFTDVNSITYSADERLIASASEDGAIKIWAADSGALLRTLNASSGQVQSVAFSPDGQLLAASTSGDQIKFWQVESGALVRTLKIESAGRTAVAFSSDWKLLAAGTSGGLVNLWDTETGALVRRIRAADFFNAVRVVAFSPDGKLLATGNEAKTIKLWDVATGNELHTLTGHADEIISLAFSPDGKMLASASGNILTRKDNSVRVWDVTSGALLHTLQGKPVPKDAFAYPMARLLSFKPDGKLLLTGGLDNALKLWDVGTGQLARTLKENFYSNSVTVGPSWQTFASFSYSDYAVELWDTTSATLLRKFAGQNQSISMLTFSPDGKQMAIALGVDDIGDTLGYVWDFESGPMSALPLHFKGRAHLLFKPDGLASVGVDLNGRISLGQPLLVGSGEMMNANAPVVNVQLDALSTDGQTLALVDDKKAIKLWDVRQRKFTQTSGGHTSIVSALVFSPDGRQLASASWDKTIKLWDAHTGQLLHTLTGHTSIVTALAFSPDGKTLISGSADYLVDRDHSIKLWDVQTGQLLRTFEGHTTGVTQLAVSPDAQTLASTARNGEIKLWELTSGKLLNTVAANDVDVSALAFHPSGRFLVAASADGTIKLLSPDTGALVATVIAFKDGNWLITSPTGLFDGSAAAWDRILWRFSPALRDVAPVEIFFNEFYYPDLLADLIAGREPKVIADIAQKDRRQPRLKLSLADLPPTTDDITTRNVKVQIDVTDAAAGAQDVRLFRNGALVKVWRGDVLQGRTTARLETVLPVVAGENRLTAYGFNHDNVKSSDATLILNGAKTLKRAGVAYILAVGVNHYENAQYDLKYAVADAQAFAAEVKRQQEGLGTYERVEVLSLYDADATKAKITAAIAQVAARAQPEDAVIIYFAGHGTAQQNQFFLIPHDLGYTGSRTQLDAQGMETLLAHAISDRELEAAFEPLSAGQILFVIDACNSGQALEAEEKRRGPMNSKGLAQLAYEKGMYILTAAQSFQAAQEVEQVGHGLLTYALVDEGLKQMRADAAPKDGTVLAREWFDYTVRRVPEMQLDKMKQARAAGRDLSFADAKRSLDLPQRSGQRPRVFYRRELETQPLVVAEPSALLP